MPKKWPSSTIDVAQAMPPAAFQSANFHHFMCTMPAIQAPKMRRPGSQRAKNTVMPPRRAK